MQINKTSDWKSMWDALMAGDEVGGVRVVGGSISIMVGYPDVIRALAFKTNISDSSTSS